MTPRKIMEAVIESLDVLYYSDPDKLDALMAESLSKFQERAGAIKTFKILSPAVQAAKPSDFYCLVSATGANGIWVDIEAVDDTVQISGTISYPVTVSYFADLRNHDFDEHLPPGATGLVRDYFEAVLTLRNVRRERAVMMATGIQRELPSDETLQARIEAIELAMTEAAEIIPMVTV